MSKLTTTFSLSLRTRMHSSVSSVIALISWCGTFSHQKNGQSHPPFE